MSTSVKYIRATVGDGKIRELKGVGGGSAKYRNPQNYLGNGQTWRIGIFQDDDTPLDVSDMGSAKVQYQDLFSSLAAHLSKTLTLNSTTITKEGFEGGTEWHYEVTFDDGDMNPTKVEKLDCVADVSGSLDGTDFTLYDADGSVGVWIDIDDSGTTIPAQASNADRAIEVTGISTDDSAEDVATAIAAALDGDSKFTAVASGDDVVITHEDSGTLTDAADGTPATGFSFSVEGEGLSGDLSKTFWLYLGGTTSGGNERTWAAESVLKITDDGSDAAPGSPSGGGTAITSAAAAALIRTITGKQSDAGGAPELTIASGAISISQSLHRVDTESDAASDDLDTINADFSLVTGDRLTLYPANDGRTVVVKHGTGNISCIGDADITMDTDHYAVEFLYTGSGWIAFAAGGSLAGALLADASVAGTGIQELLGLNLTDFAVNTIASGEVTLTQSLTTIAAESGTADDLDTMTAGKGHGDLVILKADTGDTITIKHGTGNIATASAADLTLSGNKAIAFIFDGTNWLELNLSAILSDGSVAGTAIQEFLGLNLTDFAVNTIASGAITLTQSLTTVAAESGTADDLATMTAGKGHGDLVILKADAGDTITIKHGTGNITTGGAADIALTGNQAIAFIFDGTNWLELGGLGGGGGSSLPVNDTTAIAQDPVDNTKKIRLDAGNVATSTTRVIQAPNGDSLIWAAFTWELHPPTSNVNTSTVFKLPWSLAPFNARFFGAGTALQGTGEDISTILKQNGGSVETIGTGDWSACLGGGTEEYARNSITQLYSTGDLLTVEVDSDGSGSAGSAGQGLTITLEGFFAIN